MTIAIIIPFLDEWNLIGSAVQSFQVQTHPPDEILVIIDGGEANAAERLRGVLSRNDAADSLSHSHVVVHHIQAGGAAHARNVGMKLSTSDLLVFAEADGYYSPNYVDRVLHALDDKRVGSVSPELRIANVPDRGLVARYQRRRWEAVALLTRAGCRDVRGGWAFRRSVLEELGGYNEHLLVGEDRDLVERVRAHGLRVIVARRTSFAHREPFTLWHVCKKAFLRSLHGAPYYERYGRRVFWVARVLVPMALITLPLVIATRNATAVTVLFSLGAVAMVGVALWAFCSDLELLTAARLETRKGRRRLAAPLFAGVRTLERAAALVGLGLGAWK